MRPRPAAEELFNGFPHGILLFERSGELLRVNKAVGKFLGPIRRMPDGRAPRCCDLFGCGTAAVLDGVCLAELVAEASGPLPDIRVDLAPAAPADAVWVTAAPLTAHAGRFLVEIRPADANDRRRRTEPHWIGKPRLRVFALGHTRLESREGPIDGRWLEQRAGQLFKYLICERRRVVYPEEIAAAIWPNDDSHATGTVRYFLHRLRRHLEPEPPKHGPSSFVIAANGGYSLSQSVQVDADDFEHHARLGFAARTQGDDEAAAEELERAVALYRGDLIADQPNAAWVFDERERLRTLAERALRHLLQIDLDRRDVDSALGRLRRLVQLQPFDLGLQRELLTLCLACGRRTEALRRYTTLKGRVRDQFDEDLDFQLADLSSAAALRAADRTVTAHPTSPAGASL